MFATQPYRRSAMTTAKPLARYSAMWGALASGFATAELHHRPKGCVGPILVIAANSRSAPQIPCMPCLEFPYSGSQGICSQLTEIASVFRCAVGPPPSKWQKFPVNSRASREFNAETGSHRTASSASRKCLCDRRFMQSRRSRRSACPLSRATNRLIGRSLPANPRAPCRRARPRYRFGAPGSGRRYPAPA